MIAAGLAAGWIALLGSIVARRPARRTVEPARGPSPTRSFPAPVDAIGRAIRSVLRRPADPRADRTTGALAIASVVAAAVAPPLALVPIGVGWAGGRWRRREASRAARTAIVAELPDVVDLFSLAVGAGLTAHLATDLVADHAAGTIAVALADARRRVRLGEPLADALERATAPLGDPVRPLVAAVVASDRYGAPLAPSLALVARDARLARRRAAEEAARKVPVKLLFPLVLCTLPAFALLTVVPLLAGSLRSLRL